MISEVPTIIPTVCNNEDIDIIKLFMNLPELIEISCPMTVNNIQQHQAGDTWLVQAGLIQFQNYPIKIINGCSLTCYQVDPKTTEAIFITINNSE